MSFVLLAITLTAGVPQQRISVEPFFPIYVWYAPSGDVETLRRDFSMIRGAGFNAISTWITWRDGEPRRGGYNLLNLDRMIAVSAESGLKIRVDVHPEPEPSWKTDGTNALAGQFYEYVRRRLVPRPEVIAVRYLPFASSRDDRVAVGGGERTRSARQARVAMWSAIARGNRSFGFIDAEAPASAAVLALGETAGVVTRNPALFADLEPRRQRQQATVTSDPPGGVAVDILESSNAMVIIAINRTTEVRKVTIAFPPEIPEAIWQNMEDGSSVQFAMGPAGPTYERTFAPEDVVVLAIGKKLR